MAVSYTLATYLLLIALALYALHAYLKPKPIPGSIPYAPASAKSIFGDLPGMLAHQDKTGETISFLANRCRELKSPIAQVFMRPRFLGGKPWVIICEPREAQDILLRRNAEFDRSDFFRDILISILPGSLVVLPTNDEWRAHRRLVADTMSPSFLKDAAAPRVYEAFAQLISLWREKARVAGGERPFHVAPDIEAAMFDGIFAVALSESPGTVNGQLDAVRSLTSVETGESEGEKVAAFPPPPKNKVHDILNTVVHSCEIAGKSPLSRLHHQFAVRFYPYLRRAIQQKDRILGEKLRAAGKRFSGEKPGEEEKDVRGVIDLLVSKEMAMARKQNREPQIEADAIRVELFGFLVGGYDTTLATSQWLVKLMTLNPRVQEKLRTHLRDAFAHHVENGTMPTAAEIAATEIPYLDATVEEVARLSDTTDAQIRVALKDTEVLGHHIPKGTDVFMITSGPGYKSPALPVEDESKRSKSSHATVWNGNWRDDELHLFQPERWLRFDDTKGVEVFDAQAGPMHLFGAGPRGCFGKRLARLSLRIFLTLLVWHFELLELPSALGSMAATDVLVHMPQKVFLRLKPVA